MSRGFESRLLRQFFREEVQNLEEKNNGLTLDVLRHSASHILAQAVKRLFKDAKLAIGPYIENGFYYDFDSEHRFVPEDLPIIEEEMKKIVEANYPIVKKNITKDEARKIFSEANEIYKLELIDEISDDTEITIYSQGEFIDLCKGPHVPSTGYVKYFKLLNIAGAYWRGNESNKMLQRIYGTAFFTSSELEEYLKFLSEVQKRDHRKLGKTLKLFMFDEKIGVGLPIWLPKGGILRDIIEKFEVSEHLKRGYELIKTPHIGLSSLWQTSGHLSHYKESMYPPMEAENQSYILKPMNCPFHLRVYQSEIRSYRDLPIRLFELANVYRYEKSGVLHGLLRVRGFTMDDAHIFCREDQITEELYRLMDLAKFMLHSFGFEDYKIYLSVRDKNLKDKYVGDPDKWDLFEEKLEEIVKSMEIDYQVDYGEAKFYGPAIDLKIKDALQREWQCTTIQVDFNLPERFNLSYIDKDGKEHTPIMLHRAILGSLERFISILLEHYSGDLPLWIAPEQIRILSISETVNDYTINLRDKFKENGIRCFADIENERLNSKIRRAEEEKIPYIAIIGKNEKENNTLSIRKRHGENLGSKTFEETLNLLNKEILR